MPPRPPQPTPGPSQPQPKPGRPAGPSTPKPPPGPKKNVGKAEALLPVSEVATLFRCSRDHVYDLIVRGLLRTVQLGNGRAKTRVPESSVAEFVAAGGTKRGPS